MSGEADEGVTVDQLLRAYAVPISAEGVSAPKEQDAGSDELEETAAEEDAEEQSWEDVSPRPARPIVLMQLAVVPNHEQPLRVGAYRILWTPDDDRAGEGGGVESGLFYHPREAEPQELMTLAQTVWPEVLGQATMPPSAKRRGPLDGHHHDPSLGLTRIMTAGEFMTRIFYPMVYEHQATPVGWSLPEQLTRFTTRTGPGRGFYAGGFACQLCPCKQGPSHRDGRKERKLFCNFHPRLMIKQAGYKHFMALAYRRASQGNSNGKRWSIPAHPSVNPFVDLAMLCPALIHSNGPPDLAAMCTAFGIEERPCNGPELPGTDSLITLPVGARLLHTLRRRLEQLADLYCSARQDVAELGTEVPLPEIRSAAGVASGIKRAVGEAPFLARQRERRPPKQLPDEVIGAGTSAIRGPRAECNLSHVPYLCRHIDWTSAYAAAELLADLQELHLAEWVEAVPCRDLAQRYLCDPRLLERLLTGEGRKQALRSFVLIHPQGERLPYSGPFSGDMPGLADCFVHSSPLWVPLADALVHPLLGGQPPALRDAFRLVPHGRTETRAVELFRDPGLRLDPASMSMARELVKHRQAVKRQLADLVPGSVEYRRLDRRQRLIKGLLVSGCYGLYLESNPQNAARPEQITLHAGTGQPMRATTDRREVYGRYWNGPAAALILSITHLLLAITERLGEDRGLKIARCDTDGLDFTPASPMAMSQEEFDAAVLDVIAQAQRLSPYPEDIAALRLERWNYARDDPQELIPLYGVSCDEKLHQHYNRLPDGSFDLRHYSHHGMAPEMEPSGYRSPADIPSPRQDVATLAGDGKGTRLGYDLAYRYIQRAEQGIDRLSGTVVHVPGLEVPAIGTLRLVNWAQLCAHRDGPEGMPELLPYSRVLLLRGVGSHAHDPGWDGVGSATWWPIGKGLPPARQLATCQDIVRERFRRTGKKSKRRSPGPVDDRIGWHERLTVSEGQRFYTGKVAGYTESDPQTLRLAPVRYRDVVPLDGDLLAAMQPYELDDLVVACPPPPDWTDARQWQQRLSDYQRSRRPIPVEHQALIWSGIGALEHDPLVRPWEETRARLMTLGLPLGALAALFSVEKSSLSRWLRDRVPKREQRRDIVRRLLECEGSGDGAGSGATTEYGTIAGGR